LLRQHENIRVVLVNACPQQQVCLSVKAFNDLIFITASSGVFGVARTLNENQRGVISRPNLKWKLTIIGDSAEVLRVEPHAFAG